MSPIWKTLDKSSGPNMYVIQGVRTQNLNLQALHTHFRYKMAVNTSSWLQIVVCSFWLQLDLIFSLYDLGSAWHLFNLNTGQSDPVQSTTAQAGPYQTTVTQGDPIQKSTAKNEVAQTITAQSGGSVSAPLLQGVEVHGPVNWNCF